ncbi:hypothetical protein [uncultured Helicobacter sp.]|nr:hypothetical protein [uncultured Helicobacter sp.]
MCGFMGGGGKVFCKCGLALRANAAITSQQQGYNKLENLKLQ